GIDLESAYCFKGMTMVRDGRFAASLGPTDDDDVESRGVVEQAMFLEIMEGQVGQPSLFCLIDRGGRACRVFLFGGSNLHEDNAPAVHGDNVEFALGARIIAGDNAIAQSFQKASCGTLGTGAEPTSPPGLRRSRP